MEKEKDKVKEKERKPTVRQSVQFAKPKLGSRTTSASTTATTGTRYEELPVGKPPIPITVAPRPSSARIENHPSLRGEASSPEPPLPLLNQSALDGSIGRQFKLLRKDSRRDSAVAVSSNTARDSHTTAATTTSTITDEESTSSVKKSQSLPHMRGEMAAAADSRASPSPGPKPRARLAKKQSRDAAPATVAEAPFVGLTTDIPKVTFEDLMEPEKIEFSKRGSMLLGDRMINELNQLRGGARGTNSLLAIPPIRVITPEEEVLSRRVRSMYDTGVGEMPILPEGEAVSHREGRVSDDDANERTATSPEPQSIRVISAMSGPTPDAGFVASSLRGSVIREEHELAGGFEDWQDVEGGDVDRYGFISPRPTPGTGSSTSLQTSQPPHLQRMSTQLQLASETRRGASRLGRSPSNSKSTRSAQDLKSKGPRERAIRPMSSQSSYRSTGSTSSRLRTATNRLPHNRSRRIMDEAGDMLTLPPGLADIAAAKDDGQASSRQKAKEWEREGKWRKMARITKRDGQGGGMTFNFDTRDAKLISRTWKGIPDRWRATAWQSFLAASARKRGGQPTDTQLHDAFEKLQDVPSPDDSQIDTDVPRTIGAHIMFRARYRGGQRLLFRVLHALSLFFPETGYVQGMAALAATLLCYFDEAGTFVMLVRLWMLRGLDRLYSPGFGGLMTALDELDRHWMAGSAVGAKLQELGISPTSFGTRWYLTVFNYSIPFPAQLRVWDVFFLLGDPEKPYPIPVTALEWLKEGGRKDAIESKAEEPTIPTPIEKPLQTKPKEAAPVSTPKKASSEPPAPKPATTPEKGKTKKELKKEQKEKEKAEKEEKKKARKAPLASAGAANTPRKPSTPPSEPVQSSTAAAPSSPPVAASDRAPSAALASAPTPAPASPPRPSLTARIPSPALAPGREITTPTSPPTLSLPQIPPTTPPSTALPQIPTTTPPTTALPQIPTTTPPKQQAKAASTEDNKRASTEDKKPTSAADKKPAPAKSSGSKKKTPDSFHGGLDVLHATSAALVDATREILLDSDFENAMKTLTSWVPVQDEELLMKVAMAEYRRGRKRRGARS